MDVLHHVAVPPLDLDRYKALLDERSWAVVEKARSASRRMLAGHVVWNVNSTANGGGVAEMLRPLLAYARGVGVDARWVVIGGDAPFFELTKRLHNRLHGAPGDGGPLGPAQHLLYQRTLAEAAEAMKEITRPGDVVILHDPQTAGLVPALRGHAHVVWRSHIGRDTPNAATEEGWAFLAPYIAGADAWIFSRPEYAPPGLDPQRTMIVPPSIDVFSPKNQELDRETVRAIMHATGLQELSPNGGRPVFTRVDGTPGRVDRRADLGGGAPPPDGVPLVTQVSRWDRLKDPSGVLKGFVDHVAPHTDAHLLLAGPATEAVSDDPEGAEVLEEIRGLRAALPPELRERVHLVCLPMKDAEENAAIVNALQRASAVVVQKSLAEGFGLTVGEAMWKHRPVVASAVGGIRDQIEHDVSGVLLEDPSDLGSYGAAVRGLLEDGERAASIGAAANARVRERYMSVRHLVQYEQLFEALGAGGRPAHVRKDRSGATSNPDGGTLTPA